MSISQFDPKSGKWIAAVPVKPSGLLRLVMWWRKVRVGVRPPIERPAFSPARASTVPSAAQEDA